VGFGLFVDRRSTSHNLIASLTAIFAGALQAASIAWPRVLADTLGFLGVSAGQPVWWMQILAMLLLYLLQASDSARQAAWRGWLFALAWLALTFGWLFTSMHTFGGLPAVLAVLAVLALAGALALYYAAVCWCFKALALTGIALPALIFASLWLLAELARGQWLSGFGWGAVGYAQLDGPLAGLIPWVGSYGAGFAAVLVAGLLVTLTRSTASWRARVTTSAVVVALLAGSALLPGPQSSIQGSLQVTLLQGNVPQNEKFDMATGVPQALRWYGEQLAANRSSLIITPETALALLPAELPAGYWRTLENRFASGEQAALVGVPLGNFTDGYTNSVVGLKPMQTSPWRYDKHHLVPFGEFIPPMFRWFTNLMNIPLGDFNRGALLQPTFDWQGQRLAATVCYENLFGEELATQFVDPATAPTILFNISNLGWFGDSLAMDQHLQIARMRALEFDRPFLLATNTGQTAIVDHRGRITHALAPHTAAALTGEVQGRNGITPFAWWAARWGLWPLWLLAGGLVLAAFWGKSRR
jgi:apolipoprotein N-acyltransferase